MRYPVVLFDVGETLIGPRESFGVRYAEVLATLGVSLPPAALEAGIRGSMAEMNRRIPLGRDRYRHFEGGQREYWLRFAGRAIELAAGEAPGRDLAEQALDRLGEAFANAAAWRIYDDTLPALTLLQRSGVRMAVVSNWDSNLPRVLDRLELSPYFETVGVSAIEGLEKPDPEFFRRVLGRMGAAPGEALHVGDSALHDLDGAAAAGVDALLIDRRGNASSPHAIASLAEIPGIVLDETPPG